MNECDNERRYNDHRFLRMTRDRKPVESFETYRTYLFSIAYRMLGSAMDAEDMVQETYVRYQAAPLESIRSLKAYLTTILTRLCMDQLQLARTKRELYVGPWLPEPILTAEISEAADPGKACREAGVDLTGVPGPDGATPTVRASGLPAARSLRVRVCRDRRDA